MEHLTGLYRSYERWFLLAIMFAVIGLLYLGAQLMPPLQSAAILSWDPIWHVPFVSSFIFLYWSLFLMPLFFLIGSGANANQSFFRRWVLAVLASSVESVAAYVVWPLSLPYPTIGTDDLFGRLVELTYLIDVRSNFFPSQHVTLAFLMAWGIAHERPVWRPALIVWATGIAVSTLFVRQHYVVDVIGGLVLAVIVWLALLRCVRR
ncbi:MAG: phosphatase PAP2 family protein [Patescibacteria group bacterium]